MTEIVIAPDGTLRFVHSDSVAQLARGLGELRIARASHVEPTSDGRWQADMSPVGGPALPATDTRAESLAQEHAYLSERGVPLPLELNR